MYSYFTKDNKSHGEFQTYREAYDTAQRVLARAVWWYVDVL